MATASGHESADGGDTSYGHKGYTTHIRPGKIRQEVNKDQQGRRRGLAAQDREH